MFSNIIILYLVLSLSEVIRGQIGDGCESNRLLKPQQWIQFHTFYANIWQGTDSIM